MMKDNVRKALIDRGKKVISFKQQKAMEHSKKIMQRNLEILTEMHASDLQK